MLVLPFSSWKSAASSPGNCKFSYFGCWSRLSAVTIQVSVNQIIVDFLIATFRMFASPFSIVTIQVPAYQTTTIFWILVLPFSTNHYLCCLTATPFLTATFRILVLQRSSRNSADSLPSNCKLSSCNISDAGRSCMPYFLNIVRFFTWVTSLFPPLFPCNNSRFKVLLPSLLWWLLVPHYNSIFHLGYITFSPLYFHATTPVSRSCCLHFYFQVLVPRWAAWSRANYLAMLCRSDAYFAGALGSFRGS